MVELGTGIGDGVFIDMPTEYNPDGINAMSLPERVMSASEHLVFNRFDVVTDYADKSFNTTMDYIANLEALLAALEIPSSEAIRVDTPEIDALDYTSRPSLSAVNIDTTFPANLVVLSELSELPALTDIEIPELTFSEPAWSNPERPVFSVVSEPGELPDLLSTGELPSKPTLDLPPTPVFSEILIPELPSLSIPEFTAEFVSETIDNPAAFAWDCEAYEADDSGQIWAALLSKVLLDIQNGGTGLTAAVEADLYARHLDRTSDENAKLINAASTYWAARGWTLPPGMLTGLVAEAQQQITRNNLNASRDITISQAELAQKNTHFIIEHGAKLEGMMRDFYTTNTNRLFEINKYTAQNAIEIFNAIVALHNSKVEAYKTEAAIYEAKIKGSLAAVELFKGQVEGARVTAEVQKNLTDIYKARLGALETQLKLYITEMEGAKIAIDINQSRVEVYRAGVQAYVARLDGEKAKLGIYTAELSAEETKAKVYGSRVQAYSSQVEAVASVANIKIKQLEASIKHNEGLIDKYKAELTGYVAEVQAKSALIQGQVDGFKAEASAYTAETGATAARYGVLIEEIKARIEVAKFNMEKARAEIEATSKSYVAIKTLQVEGTKGIMNVGAQLTASALNAVNASASFGFSGQTSDSTSESMSTSYQASLSESHQYDETPV